MNNGIFSEFLCFFINHFILIAKSLLNIKYIKINKIKIDYDNSIKKIVN